MNIITQTNCMSFSSRQLEKVLNSKLKQKKQLNAILFVLECCTNSTSVDQLEINEFI